MELTVKYIVVFLALTSSVLADDRIDSLARAKRLCQKEKIGMVTTIHIRNDHAGCDAVFFPDLDKIVINLLSDHWENTAERQARAYKDHFSSSSHPDHCIRHEIAHARFFHHVGKQRWTELKHMAFLIDTKVIADEVSVYACRDNLEFVAEVMTGIWSGKKYSATVMDYYDGLWE